ncbi:hypothetical protein GCM10010307_63530 [Streptomyces vastus]|uniref:Uncharacterized protein n=1 Tax=Streptomyces vastus TaxID=285451 RepID=A0ABN3RH84_9ACTN
MGEGSDWVFTHADDRAQSVLRKIGLPRALSDNDGATSEVDLSMRSGPCGRSMRSVHAVGAPVRSTAAASGHHASRNPWVVKYWAGRSEGI